MAAPYKITRLFDQDSLPEAIRIEHRTKEDVWGPPRATHHVEIDGPMRMQVEFYREYPLAGGTGGQGNSF